MRNEVNKVIFVDNLEVSFHGNIPTLTDSKVPYSNGENKVKYYNPNCFIEFKNNGNKYFRNICDLWIEGRKIGEFRFLPTSPFINDELINFKFENVQLYQKDFNRYIDYIVETFEFKYQYISHLDIAIDCIDHNLLKFVNNYLYYSNTTNYSTTHKGRLDKKNIVTNNQNIIHWGKLDSEKYIKIYNKSLELTDTNNSKSYIPVCWKENKMIVENKTVERFELTLKQKNTKNEKCKN